MSGQTADNEAKVVVTASPEAFAKFMQEAARSFQELEKQGKTSVKEIDSSITRLRNSVGDLSKAVLQKVLGTATAPIRQALDQALDSAKAWRSESTRLMGATGEDWRRIGAQIDAVSRQTIRLPGDVVPYLDTVRELTGSWKDARDQAEDYSDLSRYLGRASLAEMAPLAATMESMFGVRGQGKAREFFDATIRGAERLGQSGRTAVQSFERLAPSLGMQTAAGPRGEKFARSAAAMLPALQKLGLSPQQAEATVAQASGYFSGDLQGLQRQLRSAGLLGRKDRLQDEYGRLRYTLPELLGMVGELSRKHAKGLGGGEDLNLKLLQQNLPGLLAGAAFHGKELQANINEALAAGEKPGAPSPLAANRAQQAATPELRRMLDSIDLAAAARKTKGEAELGLEDQGARAGAAAAGPAQNAWLSTKLALNEDARELRRRGGWRAQLSRLTDWSSDEELDQQIATQRRELGPAGVAKYERNRDLVQNGSFWERLRGRRDSVPPEQNTGGSSPLLEQWKRDRSGGPLVTPAAGPAAGLPLSTPQERQDQARLTAEALGSKVLTVRLLQSTAPLSGGGNQTE